MHFMIKRDPLVKISNHLIHICSDLITNSEASAYKEGKEYTKKGVYYSMKDVERKYDMVVCMLG